MADATGFCQQGPGQGQRLLDRELLTARATAASLKAAIVGLAGPALLAEERELLRAMPPAGVILFARNVVEPAQLAALTAALAAVLPRGRGDRGRSGRRPRRAAAAAALAGAPAGRRDRRAV